MAHGNKIVRKLELNEFDKMIKRYSKENIICTEHTFFRLSQKQRKIHTKDEIIRIVKMETPFLVGVQENDNYAVFYRYREKIYRIILGIDARKINIVTFYFINEWQIPRI